MSQISVADLDGKRTLVLLARDSRGPLHGLNYVPDPLNGLTRQFAPCKVAPLGQIDSLLLLGHYPGLSLRPRLEALPPNRVSTPSVQLSVTFAAYEVSEDAAVETRNHILLKEHRELWQELSRDGRLAIALPYEVREPDLQLWSTTDRSESGPITGFPQGMVETRRLALAWSGTSLDERLNKKPSDVAFSISTRDRRQREGATNCED